MAIFAASLPPAEAGNIFGASFAIFLVAMFAKKENNTQALLDPDCGATHTKRRRR
jgi:hypothetical protein